MTITEEIDVEKYLTEIKACENDHCIRTWLIMLMFDVQERVFREHLKQ
jgi:hypothetical protein